MPLPQAPAPKTETKFKSKTRITDAARREDFQENRFTHYPQDCGGGLLLVRWSPAEPG
jgi:hypothetical protein